MNKREYRKEATTYLKSLSTKEKQQIEGMLTANLLNSSLWEHANTIGVTLAQGFEWTTKSIIEAAWSQYKRVCVPKCYPEESVLEFYQLNSFDQLEVGYYNLLEPNPEISTWVAKNEMDLMLVPGLLFDSNGYRIGFGGGYYDRFLVGYQHITASLSSTAQLVDKLPRNQFDIPVQYLITEKEIISV